MESATQIFEALPGDFRWTMLTNRDTSRTARWKSKGAQVIVAPLSDDAPRLVRGAQILNWSLRALLLARKLSRQGRLVLHSNDIRSAQALGPVAERAGLPFLHTVRDTKPAGEPYGAHWAAMAKRTTRIITLSDDMSDMMLNALPEAKGKFTTIRSIVDLDRFAPVADLPALRADLGLAPDQIHLGVVAGVFAKKGQLKFLRDVMPHLIKARGEGEKTVHLHLIGDHDPERNTYSRECAQAVDDQGLGEYVTFHGFTDRVSDWLAALDIVVVPSVREGLARCMIEAMACGVPVVSTEVCSAREMLQDTGAGVVVGQDDSPAMIDALRGLIGDPALRAQMGSVGRSTAEQRFHLDRQAGEWRNLYRAAADPS